MQPLLLFSLSAQLHNWKALLVVLLIGAIAGGLAGLILKGKGNGLLFSVILGIAGAWITNTFFGGFFNLTSSHLLNVIIGATAGALLLTLVLKLIFIKSNERDRTDWEA